MSIVDYIEAREAEDDEFWNKVQGCRRSGNQPKPQSGWNGGYEWIFTCSGAAIGAKQNPRRETRTGIIIDIFDTFTATARMILFYEYTTFLGMFCCLMI